MMLPLQPIPSSGEYGFPYTVTTSEDTITFDVSAYIFFLDCIDEEDVI
ncbi:MAG: hypothetical protein Pg6A_19940 [Termitinemataceae bacterium]|nr:MAG: hypothetical protein Pg6A_19940 [Termitinemataceae bacterium]